MKIRIYIPIIFIIYIILQLNVNAQIPYPSSYDYLDVNNNKISISNSGALWETESGNAGYQYPYNSSIPDSMKQKIIFSGGFWMKCRDSFGVLHAAAQFYNIKREYKAGPISSSGTISSASCTAWDTVFPCTKAEITSFRNYIATFGTPVPLSSIPAHIIQWPAMGNPHIVPRGMVVDHPIAPFIDANSDGIYNPIDGDFPCIKGDKAIFIVQNDLGVHNVTGAVDPLGVEIHTMAYAYATSDIINNTSFYDVKIINRSLNNYTDYYLGLAVDPDIGCFNNDYVGCQPNRNLAIAYNSTFFDANCQSRGYGFNPPILGVKLVNSPLNTFGTQTGMSSFKYFNNSFGIYGDPQNNYEFENNLHGLLNDGSPQIIGGTDSIPQLYSYHGNPSIVSEWSECHNQVSGANLSSDRRFLINSGPYTLSKNGSLDFSYAVFVSQTDSTNFPCPDFNIIINPAADSVQAFYDAIHLFCNDGVAGLSNDFQLSTKANVYPNPLVGDQLNITFDKDIVFGDYDLLISNINGQIVFSDKLAINSSTKSIDLSDKNLSKGFYTLLLQKSNNKIQAKFIVSE